MVTRRVLWGCAAVLVLAASARLVAAIAWDARSGSLTRRLDDDAVTIPATFSAADVEHLPDPVARFFLNVLREGQPLIRTAQVVTAGEFQTGTTHDGWKPFTAVQRFSTRPPGFLWDARIHMAPFTRVYVRDAYVAGRAEMHGRVFGVFPVVSEEGTRELATGELQRYLAETAWFPTALLPNHHAVTWNTIDATSARVTLTDRDVSVTARFMFTAAGDLREVFVGDRMRAVDGHAVPTPWVVRCGDHQRRHGVRIPLSCEVAWLLPGGAVPYWRGRVLEVTYDYSR